MFQLNSLLLYKNHPARLARLGDRLELELDTGEVVRVRPKDVEFLHPGPVTSTAGLKPVDGEVAAAWEILMGTHTRLGDLAELAYGEFTPSTAWSAWQQVAEGVYFEGTPGDIRARTKEEVDQRIRERERAGSERRAWHDFIARLKQGKTAPEDAPLLREVEALALGQSTRSQALHALGRAETPQNAHALLLEVNAWPVEYNPYPVRFGMDLSQPSLPVPPPPQEARLDLTGLKAYAIDDAGTDTPDDALSLDGSRLWVHIADAAAVVAPGSGLDLDARGRGLTLHLPEGSVHLLPRRATEELGLGMAETGPALSFGFDFNDSGEITGLVIAPSRVRVERLSYEQAEALMDQLPFAAVETVLAAARARRAARGAVMIDFPEVKINVEEGRVIIRPLPALRSRAMVEEAMILVGTEMARFAAEKGLPFLFSQQEPVESSERPTTLSGMFALRRQMKRSRVGVTPGAHGGLGAPAYSQVTSPLRRYLDLVCHQQIRAFLSGAQPLTEAELLERLGAVEAVAAANRQAEFASEKHWTLVHLLRNPGWRGEAILIDRRGPSGIAVLPELAWETRVHLPREYALDERLSARLTGVDLTNLEASFKVE